MDTTLSNHHSYEGFAQTPDDATDLSAPITNEWSAYESRLRRPPSKTLTKIVLMALVLSVSAVMSVTVYGSMTALF